MLQTLEAIYDPKKGLVFSEKVAITEPVKVLVTLLSSPTYPSTQPEKGSAQALMAALRAYPLPPNERPSDEEIEAQVREAEESWD